jgi:hypothetical protein
MQGEKQQIRAWRSFWQGGGVSVRERGRKSRLRMKTYSHSPLRLLQSFPWCRKIEENCKMSGGKDVNLARKNRHPASVVREENRRIPPYTTRETEKRTRVDDILQPSKPVLVNVAMPNRNHVLQPMQLEFGPATLAISLRLVRRGDREGKTHLAFSNRSSWYSKL